MLIKRSSNPCPKTCSPSAQAIRDDQEETNRFYLARQGMIPPDEFFNPENLQRLMAREKAGAARTQRLGSGRQ
jgi:hypothetical protein